MPTTGPTNCLRAAPALSRMPSSTQASSLSIGGQNFIWPGGSPVYMAWCVAHAYGLAGRWCMRTGRSLLCMAWRVLSIFGVWAAARVVALQAGRPIYFKKLFGSRRRQTPRARSNRRVASETSRRDASFTVSSDRRGSSSFAIGMQRNI